MKLRFPPNALPGALAVVCIAAYFLFFAGPGLRAGFTHDDLMNMERSWDPPITRHLGDTLLFWRVSPTFRPVGSLFYRLLFELFGFNPLPFRVACYLLLALNLWLAYALIRRLTKSREIAALTTLLWAYHREFWNLYVNTGTCYDLLCFFFYVAAFLYYLRARERKFPLGWRPIAIWSCLYVLSLNSKEMALTLPMVIAAYELLASPPGSWRPAGFWAWLRGEGRIPLVGAVLTALFVFGRLRGPEALPAMSAYHPLLRFNVYLSHAQHFLWAALCKPGWLTPAVVGAMGILLLAVTLISRRLPLRLAVVWMVVGILPVAFIPQRGLDAVYIPTLAFALFLATGLTRLAARPAILFVCVLLALVALNLKYGRIPFEQATAEGRHIESVYDQLRGLHTVFPRGGRVLFLRDPFANEEWGSTFVAMLYSRDRSLYVQRLDRLQQHGDPADLVDFDVVLSYEQDQLLECDPARFNGQQIKSLAALGCPLHKKGTEPPF